MQVKLLVPCPSRSVSGANRRSREGRLDQLPTAPTAFSDVTAGRLFLQQNVITTIAHKHIVSDILHFRLTSPKVCIFQSMN